MSQWTRETHRAIFLPADSAGGPLSLPSIHCSAVAAWTALPPVVSNTTCLNEQLGRRQLELYHWLIVQASMSSTA